MLCVAALCMSCYDSIHAVVSMLCCVMLTVSCNAGLCHAILCKSFNAKLCYMTLGGCFGDSGEMLGRRWGISSGDTGRTWEALWRLGEDSAAIRGRLSRVCGETPGTDAAEENAV